MRSPSAGVQSLFDSRALACRICGCHHSLSLALSEGCRHCRAYNLQSRLDIMRMPTAKARQATDQREFFPWRTNKPLCEWLGCARRPAPDSESVGGYRLPSHLEYHFYVNPKPYLILDGLFLALNAIYTTYLRDSSKQTLLAVAYESTITSVLTVASKYYAWLSFYRISHLFSARTRHPHSRERHLLRQNIYEDIR